MTISEVWVTKPPVTRKASLEMLIDWVDFGVDLVQFTTDAVLYLFC
jgi:hypothetical protein